MNKLTQAILLLTSDFLKENDSKAIPLTPEEWSRFSKYLYEKSLSPADLLDIEFEKKLTTWKDETITLQRLHLLLNRAVALAIAIEKWQQVGIWVITKATADKKYYPEQLKQKCKENAPPILYGVGDKSILSRMGDTIGFVVPNELSDNEKKYLKHIGKNIINDGYILVIFESNKNDDLVIDRALSQGRGVILLVSKDLFIAALNKKYRNGLMQGQLVIISPFYPEAIHRESNQALTKTYFNALSSVSMCFCDNAQPEVSRIEELIEPEGEIDENIDSPSVALTQGTLDL